MNVASWREAADSTKPPRLARYLDITINVNLKPLSFVLSFAAGAGLLGCAGADDEPLTRVDFCARWAEAACQDEVVSICQASNADACRSSQTEACLDTFPEEFQDTGVDSCLRAVSAAFADADLTADELDVVVRYGPPCNELVQGGVGGARCSSDLDCDGAAGLRCVFKDEAEGRCEVPEVVSAGLSCDEPQQTCEEGFFCNGDNCIVAFDPGDECSNDAQCGPEHYCDETCLERLPVGEDCEDDSQCLSDLCYSFDDSRTCVSRIRLSPAEPMCRSLR